MPLSLVNPFIYAENDGCFGAVIYPAVAKVCIISPLVAFLTTKLAVEVASVCNCHCCKVELPFA